MYQTSDFSSMEPRNGSAESTGPAYMGQLETPSQPMYASAVNSRATSGPAAEPTQEQPKRHCRHSSKCQKKRNRSSSYNDNRNNAGSRDYYLQFASASEYRQQQPSYPLEVTIEEEQTLSTQHDSYEYCPPTPETQTDGYGNPQVPAGTIYTPQYVCGPSSTSPQMPIAYGHPQQNNPVFNGSYLSTIYERSITPQQHTAYTAPYSYLAERYVAEDAPHERLQLGIPLDQQQVYYDQAVFRYRRSLHNRRNAVKPNSRC